MSIKTNYFDGHTYSAADDRRPWYSLMDDGVFGIATQALKVVASSPADLSVNVQPGACIVAGYYIYSDAVVNLPIIANTSGYNRVDIVVVEVDEVNKETDIRIVQGTPTSTPTAPLPNEQQYVLAEIFVGNNVSVIENSNITDRREEAMTKTLKTHQAESANKHIHSEGTNWIRFDNGWQICTGRLIFDSSVLPSGGLLTSTLTFPQPFIAAPHVSFGIRAVSHAYNALINYDAFMKAPTTDEVEITVVHQNRNNTITTITVHIQAIGRWK